MLTRSKLAVLIAIALVMATVVSMHRWDRLRTQTRALEQSRVELARDLAAERIRRLPMCIWVRDFLRTKTEIATSAFAPEHEYENGAAIAAVQLARYGCDIGRLFDQEEIEEEPLGQSCRRWADRIDVSLEKFATKVSRGTAR